MVRVRLRSPNQPWWLRWLLAGYEWAASLQLAVPLITLTAAVLAWATFVEKWYGTEAVWFGIYRAWWFMALVALLGLNVLCATLIRWPWKKHQAGFVITHTGILVLLVGCLLQQGWGIQGQMILHEGEASNLVYEDEKVFRLEIFEHQWAGGQLAVDQPVVKTVEVPFRSGPFHWADYFRMAFFPWRIVPRDQGRIYDQDGITLEVLDYYADSQRLVVPRLVLELKRLGRVSERGQPPVQQSPASGQEGQNFGQEGQNVGPEGEGSVQQGRLTLTVAPVGRPHAGRRPFGVGDWQNMPWGPPVVFWLAGSPAECQAFLHTGPDGQVGTSGQVVLWHQGNVYRFALPELQKDGPQRLGDSGLQVALLQHDERLRAVELEIRRLAPNSPGPVRMFLFAQNPSHNRQAEALSVYGSFWVEPPQVPQRLAGIERVEQLRLAACLRLDLLQGPDGTLYYRQWHAPRVVSAGLWPGMTTPPRTLGHSGGSASRPVPEQPPVSGGHSPTGASFSGAPLRNPPEPGKPFPVEHLPALRVFPGTSLETEVRLVEFRPADRPTIVYEPKPLGPGSSGRLRQPMAKVRLTVRESIASQQAKGQAEARSGRSGNSPGGPTNRPTAADKRAEGLPNRSGNSPGEPNNLPIGADKQVEAQSDRSEAPHGPEGSAPEFQGAVGSATAGPANSGEFWIPLGGPRFADEEAVVSCGHRRVALRLDYRTRQLGMKLYLHKFTRKVEPGSLHDAHYSSLVDVWEGDTEPKLRLHKVLITMNQPLSAKDPASGRTYRFYQSSFAYLGRPGDPEFDQWIQQRAFRRAWEEAARPDQTANPADGATESFGSQPGLDPIPENLYRSILSVNYDPGRGLKYAGSLLIVLGIAVMYWMRAYIFAPGAWRLTPSAGRLTSGTGRVGPWAWRRLAAKGFLGLVAAASWAAKGLLGLVVAAGWVVGCGGSARAEELDWSGWRRLPVFAGGRMMPLDSFARSVVEQICGRVAPHLGLAETLPDEDLQRPEYAEAWKLFPDGKARTWPPYELIFSWLVEPQRWERVPFLVGQHHQLREELLGLRRETPSGRPIRYVSPWQLEHADAFWRWEADLRRRRREAEQNGQPFQPTGLDRKAWQLVEAYSAWQELCFSAQALARPHSLFRTRLAELHQTWHATADAMEQALEMAEAHRQTTLNQPDQLPRRAPTLPPPRQAYRQFQEAMEALQGLVEQRPVDRAAMEQHARLLRRSAGELADWFDHFYSSLRQSPLPMPPHHWRQMQAHWMALVSRSRELHRLAWDVQTALFDNSPVGGGRGEMLRLVPSLNPFALEQSRTPEENPQPWLTWQALLEASLSETLADYPTQEIQAVRDAFRQVAQAYQDRQAPDRAERFAQSMAQFTDALGRLGEAINRRRANLPVRQRDQAAFQATQYPPPGSTDLEVHYNQVDPFRAAWIGYLLAVAGFALAFGRVRRVMFWLGMAVSAMAQIFILYGLGLRYAITGWVPVTNMFETVVFVSLTVGLMGWLLALWPMLGPGLKLAWQLTAWPTPGSGTPEPPTEPAPKSLRGSENPPSAESSSGPGASENLLPLSPTGKQESPGPTEELKAISPTEESETVSAAGQREPAGPTGQLASMAPIGEKVGIASPGSSAAAQEGELPVWPGPTVRLWRWIWAPVRLVLMAGVFYALTQVHYGEGEGYTVVSLTPRVEQPEALTANDLVAWVVGLAFLGVCMWYVPRALLAAVGAVWTAPAVWRRLGLHEPSQQVLGRKVYAFSGAVMGLLGALLAYYAPPTVLDKSIAPLRPVLRDNFWLTAHVLTITASYGAGALALALGNLALFHYLFGRYRTVCPGGVPGTESPTAQPPRSVSRRPTMPLPEEASHLESQGPGPAVPVQPSPSESSRRGLPLPKDISPSESLPPEAVPSEDVAPEVPEGRLADDLTAEETADSARAKGPRQPVRREPAACQTLAQYIYRAMQAAVLLLAAGTLLGALWADVAWGRFWGWDAKEVWSLITLLVYMVVLHGRYIGWFGNFGMAAFAVLGATSILMAWYGVNYVLDVGLHTYGRGTGGLGVVLTVVAADWLFLAAAAVRYYLQTQSLPANVSALGTDDRSGS